MRPRAVVLAGGDGVRLQELTQRISGDSRPKQFCPFFGDKSLLVHTRERIRPLFGEGRTVFVLARAHEHFYREDLSGVPASRKIVQPANRGTAAAMALCLRIILEQDEDAVVTFFPSDHYYSNTPAFQKSVDCGLRLIPEYPEHILIVGAEARYPEVEYGWIQPGRPLVETQGRWLHQVCRFCEKPTLAQAKLLKRRGCLWNTFVTMGRAATFWAMLKATVPVLVEGLVNISRPEEVESLYDAIPSLDFSRSVLSCLPERLLILKDGESGWTDFGNQRRIIDTLTLDDIQPSWMTKQRPEFAENTKSRKLPASVPTQKQETINWRSST